MHMYTCYCCVQSHFGQGIQASPLEGIALASQRKGEIR